jgi:hypothetical protein
VAGCCDDGNKPSGSGATELVIVVCRQMLPLNMDSVYTEMCNAFRS